MAHVAAAALTATRTAGAVVLSWVSTEDDNKVASMRVFDTDPMTYTALYTFDESADTHRASHMLATTMQGPLPTPALSLGLSTPLPCPLACSHPCPIPRPLHTPALSLGLSTPLPSP